MAFRAVLFDLDGTLLDTLEDLAESADAVLASLGASGHPVQAYRRFVGDGVATLMARALPAGRRDEATVALAVERMREEYGRRCMAKTRPYPGVPELLSALAERAVPFAVLSNKQDDFTRLTVAKFLPGFPFAAVRGVRPGEAVKPDPHGAIEIAAALGIACADFLYLGDTNTDMRTALAAGMRPVGALWGFRDEEELRAAGARALLRHPPDLLLL